MPRGIVRDVDTLPLKGDDPPDPPDRRRVPRTDVLLADPRLADAERRLGRALVKAAVSRAQQQARTGQIAPEEVADAAVAELPARAAADSGARPRLVCTSTPVALITGVSAAARAGSSATAASATSSGAICPALARCWARLTAALTSARPSLRSASARRGSASSTSVRGTRRLSGGSGGASPARGSVSTSRTIPRGIGIQRPPPGRGGAVKARTTKK